MPVALTLGQRGIFMPKELDGYGLTAGDYKGGSGANLNEQGKNNHWGGQGGNAGNKDDENSSNMIFSIENSMM